MSDTKEHTELIPCNQCGHETKHRRIAEHKVADSEPYGSGGYHIEWETISGIFECLGCEGVTFRRKHWFSEWDGGFEVTYFPPRISRQLPRWIKELPCETVEWRGPARP